MAITSKLKTQFRRVLTVLCATLFLVAGAGSSVAEAATYTYVPQYVKINVPDDTLVMTQSTSRYDEVWAKAGITDVSGTLDDFKQMNVVASFCEPATKRTVNFIFKKTAQTTEKFSFADASDEEIISYMAPLYEAAEADGIGVTTTIHRDFNDKLPFFRIVLDATNTERPCTEIIYGTLVNGQLLQFDYYVKGSSAPDDSFAEQIVRNIEFTTLLTIDEYNEEVRQARTTLILIAGTAIIVIGGLIALSVWTRKKREKRVKTISTAMTEFRSRLRNGEIDTSVQPKYIISTGYDNDLMDEFGIFNAWFNIEYGFVLTVLLFTAILIFMVKAAHLLFALLMAVMLIVLLCIRYSQSEKQKEALSRRYNVKEKPTAVFKFYDEYFTVSGLVTAGEYIYKQVTKVRSFRSSLYIFVGDSQAFIIRKEAMENVSIADIKQLCKRA